MPTLTLRPNAAGDETNLTTQYPDSDEHWDKVDEESPDADSTYVASVASNYDLYNLPNHTTEDGTINHVKVVVRVRKTDETSEGCKQKIKIGGTEYDGTVFTATDTYVNYYHQWDTNPKTEAAWVWDDIDSLQAGVYLLGGILGPHRCTQLYVEVDYSIDISIDAPLSTIDSEAPVPSLVRDSIFSAPRVKVGPDVEY